MLHLLPVEILRYILDKIDAHTILCSFRHTCRRLRDVVDDYDRYLLDFQSISKPDFDRICHLIDPNRVRFLILSENGHTFDQIQLFLSHFRLSQFNRLQSLSLFLYEEEAIKNIIERFNISTLRKFSLKIDRFDDRRKTTTARLLSTIIAKSNLCTLQLHMQDGRFQKIIWPTRCSIEYLEINNSVAIEQLHCVFQCSPHLRTLIINSVFLFNPEQTISRSFDQLTSLTLNKLTMKIDDLESFLLMTPALTYLKLIGNGNFLNGQRWENFIQLYLSQLKKFEFHFTESFNTPKNLEEMKMIVMKFQTPFWLELKKWFLICELDADTSKSITLYSIPMCIPVLAYDPRKTSISTYPDSNGTHIATMDNVNTLKLDFTKAPLLDMKQENRMQYPLFHKVKKLELQFGLFRDVGWIEFVSNLIDLKTIVEVKVSSAPIRQSNPYMVSDMSKLLRQASNLSSVDICFDFLSRKSCLTAANIYSLIPSHVQHLAVAIKGLNEITTVLEQRPQLSSASFMFDYTPTYSEVTAWLDNHRKGSSYQADSFSVCVWLAKSTNHSKEIDRGCKRMKLTDESHQT